MKYLIALNYIALPVFLFFCCPALKLEAQSAAHLLQKIEQRYQALENASMQVEVYTYSAGKSAELAYTGELKKLGESYYTKIWDREVMVKDGGLLVVDHHSNEIAIGRTKPGEASPFQLPTVLLDSLFARGGIISEVQLKSGQKMFSVTDPSALIRQTDFYINADNLLTRLVYHYQKKDGLQSMFDKVELRYLNIKLAPPDDAYFDLARYYQTSSDGSLLPSNNYDGYLVKSIPYQELSNFQF